MPELIPSPLVRAAIGSLVRKGIVLMFGYFGLDRILSAPEHAALADYASAAVMILLGLAITQVWAYFADAKLLSLPPSPPKE